MKQQDKFHSGVVLTLGPATCSDARLQDCDLLLLAGHWTPQAYHKDNHAQQHITTPRILTAKSSDFFVSSKCGSVFLGVEPQRLLAS